MYIVLDSNILFKNFRLNSIIFNQVKDYLAENRDILCIPEVVYLETLDNFREKLEENIEKVKNSISYINTMTSNSYSFDQNFYDVSKQLDEYKTYLSKLSHENKLIKINYPKISNVKHRTMIERSIKHLKPFNNKDRGYRDTLIWLNILELAKTGDKKVAFISDNSRDFAKESKGRGSETLHADLISELEKQGLEEKVLYFTSLYSFFEKHIMPNLTQVNQTVVKFLQINKKYSSFNDVILDALRAEINHNYLLDLDFLNQSASVEEIEKILDLEIVEEVEAADKHIRVISISAKLQCEVSYGLHKTDLLSRRGVPIDFHVVDYSWSENYARVCSPRMASLFAYLTVNMKEGIVEDIDVRDLL